MLTLSKADWELVPVAFFKGATREEGWRASVNEMGEVPVLEHRGERLTQSGVILDYLSTVLGTFGGRGEAESREIWRWILFDNHKFTSYFATHRFLNSIAPQAPDPAVLGFLKTRVDAAFAIVEKHLATRKFMLGAKPTIADFSLIGYMYYPSEETGYDLAKSHPAIYAWTQRMRFLPGWKGPYELMPGVRPELRKG